MADKKISDETVLASPAGSEKVRVSDSGSNYSVTLTAIAALATKTTVGLGNVDNTSDSTKSSATATLTNKTINGQNNLISNASIWGLACSNNASDATNDIDIAVGAAPDVTSGIMMVLASALTKRLDASWVVGTGNGGLDTGSIADGTYHIWLIQRSDTGVVDALFSASASAPTMPSGYDRKWRIWSIIRASSAIKAFRQYKDRCHWVSIAVDRNSASAVADGLLALTIPAGIRTRPILALSLSQGTAGMSQLQFGDGDASAISYNACQAMAASEVDRSTIESIMSNTASQIHFALVISSGTVSASVIATLGYTDIYRSGL